MWYSRLTSVSHAFPVNLAYEVQTPIIYGDFLPSLKLLKRAILHREERFFIVGWMNPTTRILVPLFMLMRRPYNMWFDMPEGKPDTLFHNSIRALYYWMLKNSNAKVFAAGKNAVEYFRRKHFPEGRLVNLPIYVKASRNINVSPDACSEVRAKYSVTSDDLFVVTGSRLILEKGFDLLIAAVASSPPEIRSRLKVLIVGKGPEKEALLRLVKDARLIHSVFFEDWMSNADFIKHLSAADIAVHPARFDAYGGITLSAMAVGVPVIGSDGAGSAVDRVTHGTNGWIYKKDDTAELARLLAGACLGRNVLKRMGIEARKTAERYTPEAGAKIILEQSI